MIVRAMVAGRAAAGRARTLVWSESGTSATGGSFNKQWDGALGVGQQVEVADVIVFAQPGYYRIDASIIALDEVGALQASRSARPLVGSVNANVWVLIESDGGRITDGYDPNIGRNSSRTLSHGSRGEFLELTARGAVSSVRSTQLAQQRRDVGVVGRLTYYEQNGTTFSRVPLPGASIHGSCYDLYNVRYTDVDAVSDENGDFRVPCYDNDLRFEGEILLFNNATNSAYVKGRNGASVGTISLGPNSYQDVWIGNDNAAQVFINHNRYAPYAYTRFSRERSQIDYWVSEGPTYGTSYGVGTNRIIMGPNSIWNDIGTFAVMHEYGHAFHYLIDANTGSGCTDSHDLVTPDTRTCAYFEGFADFFAVWVMSMDAPSNTQLNQLDVELGLKGSTYFRTVGDGMLVEGAVAALLLDMVDVASDNDALFGDDDALSMTGSQLADLIYRCRFSSPTATVPTGADQLIYCAENSLSSAGYAPSGYQATWRSFGGLTFDIGTPTLPNQANFRARWKHNLYNQ